MLPGVEQNTSIAHLHARDENGIHSNPAVYAALLTWCDRGPSHHPDIHGRAVGDGGRRSRIAQARHSYPMGR